MNGKRSKYIYAVVRSTTGLICTRGWEPVGGKPVMAVYRTKKQAEADCPQWGEVRTFKEVKNAAASSVAQNSH